MAKSQWRGKKRERLALVVAGAGCGQVSVSRELQVVVGRGECKLQGGSADGPVKSAPGVREMMVSRGESPSRWELCGCDALPGEACFSAAAGCLC